MSWPDALIQPYSGHESRQSLEIYSRLALVGAQQHYGEAITRVPCRTTATLRAGPHSGELGLVEDVVEAARRRAARAPGGRLDPPLTLMLDEAANIAPLPSLPSLLSDGGGTGLTTLAVLQSLAQARARWGHEQARSMWDAATVKIVLGGLADIDDLEDISRLAGEYDETSTTRTSSTTGGSRSTSFRRARVLPVEELRTLPFGWALLLHRTLRPVRLQMTPWWSRPDAEHVSAGIAIAEARTGEPKLRRPPPADSGLPSPQVRPRTCPR